MSKGVNNKLDNLLKDASLSILCDLCGMNETNHMWQIHLK